MILLTDICLWFCLGCVTFQDLKRREISFLLIPLLLIGFAAKGILLSDEVSVLVKNSLLNLGFIGIQLFLLTLYVSIKNKKLINIINTYLGIGDILFFLVICIAFSPFNFIAFFIFSMLLTLSAVIIYNIVTRKKSTEIPLAGAMALVMSILMIITFFFPSLDLYNDEALMNFIAE